MYCLEWSKKQNCFHVQNLVESLAKNQESFMADTSHDYIVLMVGTFKVCTEMADRHREVLIERSAARPEKDAI